MSNAHHHPPVVSFARVNSHGPGRVNDVVGQSLRYYTQQPKQPGQNQPARRLKNQEGILGGGDSRGERLLGLLPFFLQAEIRTGNVEAVGGNSRGRFLRCFHRWDQLLPRCVHAAQRNQLRQQDGHGGSRCVAMMAGMPSSVEIDAPRVPAATVRSSKGEETARDKVSMV